MTFPRDARTGSVALAGTYLVVFGTAVVAGVRTMATGATSALTPGWSDRVATLEGYVFYVVVVVVTLRWLRRRAPQVYRQIGLNRPPTPSLIAATAVYVAIAAGSGWTGDRIATALHWTAAGAVRGDTATELLVGVGGATSAAFCEEIVLMALAAAVVARVCAGRSRVATLAITLGVLLALRWSVHLYYLGTGVFVLFWAPCAYVLFRCARSVWPLIAGHLLYDVALTVSHAVPAARAAVTWLVAVVTAVGVVVTVGYLSRTVRWRPCVLAAQP